MHTQQQTNSNQDDAKTNFLPVVVDACDQALQIYLSHHEHAVSGVDKPWGLPIDLYCSPLARMYLGIGRKGGFV